MTLKNRNKNKNMKKMLFRKQESQVKTYKKNIQLKIQKS